MVCTGNRLGQFQVDSERDLLGQSPAVDEDQAGLMRADTGAEKVSDRFPDRQSPAGCIDCGGWKHHLQVYPLAVGRTDLLDRACLVKRGEGFHA